MATSGMTMAFNGTRYQRHPCPDLQARPPPGTLLCLPLPTAQARNPAVVLESSFSVLCHIQMQQVLSAQRSERHSSLSRDPALGHRHLSPELCQQPVAAPPPTPHRPLLPPPGFSQVSNLHDHFQKQNVIFATVCICQNSLLEKVYFTVGKLYVNLKKETKKRTITSLLHAPAQWLPAHCSQWSLAFSDCGPWCFSSSSGNQCKDHDQHYLCF